MRTCHVSVEQDCTLLMHWPVSTTSNARTSDETASNAATNQSIAFKLEQYATPAKLIYAWAIVSHITIHNLSIHMYALFEDCCT